jgi:hypothetical protein
LTAVHAVLGTLVTVLFAGAGTWGAIAWWRVVPAPGFWPVLRAAQLALLAEVLLGTGLWIAGRRPEDPLHYLYGLLPVAVSFIAEQLRVASAETVLDRRGLASAQDMAGLPEGDQRSIVLSIIRRELGAAAAGALACAALAIRAATTG